MTCDPREHLLKDVVTYDFSEDIAYAFFSEVDSARRAIQKTGASITIPIDGQPIPVGFEDARTYASMYRSRTGETLSRSQNLSIVESKMSDNAVKAYIACLQLSEPLIVVVQSMSEDGSEITVYIDWRTVSKTAMDDLTVTLSGGQLIDGATSITFPMERPVFQKSLRVLRDSEKSVSVIVEVDSLSRSIEVPLKNPVVSPRTKWISSTLEDIYRGDYHGPDTYQRRFSIVPEPGCLLIPSLWRNNSRCEYGRPDAKPGEDAYVRREGGTPWSVEFIQVNQHGFNPGKTRISGEVSVLQVSPANELLLR